MVFECSSSKTEALKRLTLTFFAAGDVPNGLCSSSVGGGSRVFYPLGNSVVVRKLDSGNQTFLTGHVHVIACLHLSESGKILVTGERHQIGTKVNILFRK